MPHINPYLTFSGNCEEVFEFYKAAFGGEFAAKVRFKDTQTEQPMPVDEGEKIMHVSLPIGKGTLLMGSDMPKSMGAVTPGNLFSISVNTDSENEATTIFNKLSSGGKVSMPLQKTFWGAFFGMFTDKFGVRWMVSYDYQQPS